MIVLDTDVLISHLRGLDAARDWLAKARSADQLTISAVTVTEITGGMRSPERLAVWQLLNAFQIHCVTEPVARRAGQLMRQYRRSHSGIDLADYLIAGTTLELGAELATLNVRHYPMIPDLRAPFGLRQA